MTQAPATPELVERLNEMASMPFTRFHYADDAVMVKQAATALEAQQARIAELEVENERLRLTMLGGEDVAGFASSLPLAQVLDSFRTYETALRDRANSAQALADRYEKALRPFADAWEVAQKRLPNGALAEIAALARHYVDAGQWQTASRISSSQGRHEGGDDVLPESPGVNAVPLPASPDGPSQMDRVWAAVNVLGAPDTACTSDEDRAYCRAIGDALSEIEKLGGRPQ